MKTMKTTELKKLPGCLKFRQLFILVFAITTTSTSLSQAAENYVSANVSRKPAAVEEEVLTIPLTNETFSNEFIFAEDDAGVMKDMKESLSAWEKTEEFARIWDLQDTGVYSTPTTSQKGKYISKKMLRYADKRLSGEMKKADEGSTLHRVSRVEKQLRPNASVNLSKNFGLKFKARVLQGKATVEFKNPWVECNATVGANGKARVVSRKEFKSLGLASGAEYSVNDSQFLTYVDQQITDNVKARVSNISGNDADSRVEMTASFPFNL